MPNPMLGAMGVPGFNPRSAAIGNRLSRFAEPEEAPESGPVQEALDLLMGMESEDPKIQQAISLLQESAGGPSESPEDTKEKKPGKSPADSESDDSEEEEF